MWREEFWSLYNRTGSIVFRACVLRNPAVNHRAFFSLSRFFYSLLQRKCTRMTHVFRSGNQSEIQVTGAAKRISLADKRLVNLRLSWVISVVYIDLDERTTLPDEREYISRIRTRCCGHDVTMFTLAKHPAWDFRPMDGWRGKRGVKRRKAWCRRMRTRVAGCESVAWCDAPVLGVRKAKRWTTVDTDPELSERRGE